MSNQGNLSPWSKGQSGNPAGRPKGSKNLSTTVKNLLADEKLFKSLKRKQLINFGDETFATNGAEAIVIAMLTKAMNGDIQSAEWLRKAGYSDQPNEEQPQPTIALVRFIGEDEPELATHQIETSEIV